MLGDHLGADRDRRAGHRGRTPATPRCPAVRRYPASTQGRPFPAGLGSRRGGARKHPAATVADLSTAASAAVSDVESAGRSSTTGRAARRRRRTPSRGAALESAPGRAVAARRLRRRGGGARRGRRWNPEPSLSAPPPAAAARAGRRGRRPTGWTPTQAAVDRRQPMGSSRIDRTRPSELDRLGCSRRGGRVAGGWRLWRGRGDVARTVGGRACPALGCWPPPDGTTHGVHQLDFETRAANIIGLYWTRPVMPRCSASTKKPPCHGSISRAVSSASTREGRAEPARNDALTPVHVWPLLARDRDWSPGRMPLIAHVPVVCRSA